MKYKRYRTSIPIIEQAIYLYYRMSLSFRDIEEIFQIRGIQISHETIRQWCLKFGKSFAKGIKRRKAVKGDKWHIDEMQIKINGVKYWLWRAVDQYGNELECYVTYNRKKADAKRFSKGILKDCDYQPRVVVTDKLRSYNKPIKSLLKTTDHRKHKGLNNRVENAHQTTRRKERQMIKFKDPRRAIEITRLLGQVKNLFGVKRSLLSAEQRRNNLNQAYNLWHEIALRV